MIGRGGNDTLTGGEGEGSAPFELGGFYDEYVAFFEDLEAVRTIEGFLNKIWDYAVQSRRIDQEPASRLTEILPEVFIAGSDLSQQVGQVAATSSYREAKQEIVSWLARRGLRR